MKRAAVGSDDELERSRARVTLEWRELKRAIRSETGLAVRGIAWAAGIGGLAIGLELARRWHQRRKRRPALDGPGRAGRITR